MKLTKEEILKRKAEHKEPVMVEVPKQAIVAPSDADQEQVRKRFGQSAKLMGVYAVEPPPLDVKVPVAVADEAKAAQEAVRADPMKKISGRPPKDTDAA